MCWMTLRREDDALASGLIETKKNESSAGGDSWGYAYVDDGELVIKKRVGEIPADLPVPEVDMALVHTRLTTRGGVNYTNAHPMKIRHNDETIAAMAHNGTWYEAPEKSWFSDTWHMARVLENKYDGSFEEAFCETAERCGETMVALTNENVGYVYAGRFSIHGGGSVFQSTDAARKVPDGHVLRIDPDGSVETVATGLSSPRIVRLD